MGVCLKSKSLHLSVNVFNSLADVMSHTDAYDQWTTSLGSNVAL